MTLADKISEALAANPAGLKAREIAKLINEDRHTVNSFLYANQSEYSIDNNYVWTTKHASAKPAASVPAKPITPVAPNSTSTTVNSARCCYVNNIGAFLVETEQEWLDQMQKNFTRIMSLPLGESQVRAWKDCFRVLKTNCLLSPQFALSLTLCLNTVFPTNPVADLTFCLLARSR